MDHEKDFSLKEMSLNKYVVWPWNKMILNKYEMEWDHMKWNETSDPKP